MSSSIGRPNAKAAYSDLDKLSSLNETEQSSYVVTKPDKKLLAAQQLYKASHRLSNISSSRAISTIHHRDKRARHEYNNVLPASLPIPANGHQYTKPEALAVLLANDSRAAVKQKIELKYVPCGKSSLYQMLQFYNQVKPILNTAWSTGRPESLKKQHIIYCSTVEQ